MCKQAGIQGYFTNHSLRTTTVTRLYHAGVDERLVMEWTGHRGLEGIHNYKCTSMEQCEAILDVLNCKKMCVAYNEVHSSSVSLPCKLQFLHPVEEQLANISSNSGHKR